jgi:hypothetical protein
MSITLNTLVYNQDSFLTPNRVQYVGPANTFAVRDQLALARTSPKPSGTFRGVARAQVKRVKTLELDDGNFADAIVTIDVAVPVGAASADIDALCNDVGDFAVSTDMSTLVNNHDITY